MNKCGYLKISFLIFILSTSYSIKGQTLKIITEPNVSPAVYGVLEIPASPGSHPSVIILHGGNGWNDGYGQFAKSIADSGYVALAIDLFHETGGWDASGDNTKKWQEWTKTVRMACNFLQQLQASAHKPIGLIGLSMGAYLSISIANSIPEVQAVVDFFGAGGVASSLENETKNFPPLLILHGEKDSIVPIQRAYDLRDAVLSQGSKVETHFYPEAKHAFNAPWSPNFSATATEDAYKNMYDFLKRNLEKQ